MTPLEGGHIDARATEDLLGWVPQKQTLRRIWVQAICTRSTFRGVRGEIGTGRDATQMSKWGGHGCGKPRKASPGTPGHVEYNSGLSYLRDKEAGWLSTIPIHHWLKDAPRGVRTLSFQSPPRAGSCSIADRSISVEYWEMRGDRQGTLHTHSLVLIIAPGWAERGKKTYRESVNYWHIIKFFPWPKRQNHGLTARVLSWKSLEKTENRRSVKLSDVKSETLKYTQKQMWGNRKTQLRAWSQKWEKSSKVISASPAQKELSQSALELWPVAIPWTASFPPVENREDSYQFDPILTGRTDRWKMEREHVIQDRVWEAPGRGDSGEWVC